MGERDTGEIEREIQGEREEETGEKEREIGRETGWERESYRGEREGDTGEKERERQGREREREREGRKRERGRKKKITNTKKFMEFYLVVLHSAERSEARQWIVARQVSCYKLLSCFNPVTIKY